jgi:hypothetical protein
MAEPCYGCGTTAIHPFEGLVRSIMDGERYYVRRTPPLQALYGACEGCDWKSMHRVIPEFCPQCDRPIRLVSREEP